MFNFDATEIAANPVHLMYVLEKQSREQFPKTPEDTSVIKEPLVPRYVEFIGKEIQTAYLESYSEYGQNLFDRYVLYSDFWMQDQEYRDPETGENFDRKALNDELEKIEKPAGISKPQGFPQRDRQFRAARARRNNQGRNPAWNELREAPHGHRAQDVLHDRRSSARDLVQCQGVEGRPAEAPRFRGPDGGQGLHGEADPPALGVVPAGTQGERGAPRVLHH